MPFTFCFFLDFTLALTPLARSRPTPLHGHAKLVQPKQRQRAQPNRHRLLRPDRARHAAARQHHAREQRELRAVALALPDPEAAEAVLCTLALALARLCAISWCCRCATLRRRCRRCWTFAVLAGA